MTTPRPGSGHGRPATSTRSLPPSSAVPPRPGRGGARTRRAPLAWLPWVLLASLLALLALVLLLGRLAGSGESGPSAHGTSAAVGPLGAGVAEHDPHAA